MTLIINLTQHPATPTQIEAGVVDLPVEKRRKLLELLTFEKLPSWQLLDSRAAAIAALAICNDLGPEDGEDPFPDYAMIGGAPYFMSHLEGALADQGIPAIYAFSRRIVSEQIQPDGTVKKVSTFSHEGFVGMDYD